MMMGGLAQISDALVMTAYTGLQAHGEGAAEVVGEVGHQTGLPGWQVAVLGAVLTLMVLTLALEEKIHAQKSVITGVFAVLALLLGALFGCLPFDNLSVMIGGVEAHLPVYIPAIEWEVIAIILGSSVFVDVTSQSGIFSWIAIRLTKVSKGDPLVLLVFYGLLTVVFSAVLNNVAAMIIIGSLTGVSLKRLGRENLLLGFLLVEGLLTNVGGLLTLISSVPNIIVGNTAGFSFTQFFFYASPYVFIATIATLILGAVLFKIKRLKGEAEKIEAAELVAGFDETDGIPSARFFWGAAVAFVLFVAALAGQSVIPLLDELGMGFVAIMFAMGMLVVFRSEAARFYSALDWDLLFFFMGLFVVINVMEHGGVLHVMGDWISDLIGDGGRGGAAKLLASSAVASSVTDNIPLSAMLAKVLAAREALGTPVGDGLWWAVVFGSNLGGNLTPIGSASTVVAVTIIHKYKIKLGFGKFVMTALPFAVMQILLAIGYVLLRY